MKKNYTLSNNIIFFKKLVYDIISNTPSIPSVKRNMKDWETATKWSVSMLFFFFFIDNRSQNYCLQAKDHLAVDIHSVGQKESVV
jgi:hypothetical protein